MDGSSTKPLAEAKIVKLAKIDKTADLENVVNRHVWVTEAELAKTMHKPSSLGRVAFDPNCKLIYDPLELIVS